MRKYLLTGNKKLRGGFYFSTDFDSIGYAISVMTFYLNPFQETVIHLINFVIYFVELKEIVDIYKWEKLQKS